MSTHAKSKRDEGNPLAGAKVLAADVRRDLKHNVRDVEAREQDVVLVAVQLEILFETRKSGIA